jgi:hypothetical protein
MPVTTTQVRPLAGGAWNNVTLNGSKTASKSTTYGVTLAPGLAGMALLACNQWVNSGGTGTAAARAQKIAKAAGLQLQEV